jgi:plastocyanin
MTRILFLTSIAGLLCLLLVAAPGTPGRATDDAPAPASPPAPEKKEDKTPAATAGSTGSAEAEKKYPPQDPALGAIEGRVTLEGDPPALKPPDTTGNKDHAFCTGHLQDLQLLVSSAKEVQNAVISVAGYKPETKPAAREVILDNKHCTFLPRIQATTVGSKLTVTSSDPFLHNTHGLLAASFNKAIAKGDEIVQKLLKQGDVLIKCDFHPWMQAWIKVFAHDLFDVTDPKGTFKLVNVPPGEHEIEVWHEFLEAPKQKVKVEPGKTVKLDFRVQAKGKKKS